MNDGYLITTVEIAERMGTNPKHIKYLLDDNEIKTLTVGRRIFVSSQELTKLG